MPLQNRKINPWTWQDQFGISQAIETTGHSRVVRCAGQASLNENGEPVHVGDMPAQVAKALDNLETVLKAANMTLANVVRLNIYTTDVDKYMESYDAAQSRLEAANCCPAVTFLGVSRLAFPGLMVELEATAVA